MVDVHDDISALVNCGGFAKAFAPSDLSDCGLIPDHTRAASVQRLLRQENPDEHHADCVVWAVWQLTGLATNKGG